MSKDETPDQAPEATLELAPVELLVCATCRSSVQEQTDPEAARPGALLSAALSEKAWPDHVTLREVECLSNCTSGCSVAIRGGADRWTYVYGNFDGANDADVLHEGAVKYASTPDGVVPWRERPVHFRKNCIARVPPLNLPD